jgi:Protein of unknown function (DUF1573)
MRNAVLVLVALMAVASALRADDGPWAEKLFDKKTEHNFGNVAHGTQMHHDFSFKNIYNVPLDVTITSVSCGCTTATVSTAKVEPLGTGTIDVNMNGRIFVGPRTVYIYVKFNNPSPLFYSTAMLKVTANSRPDIVFNPGEINFGIVTQGRGGDRNITVEYAGILQWAVTEVVTNGLPVEAKVEQLRTKPGLVAYKVSVSLKADVPTGALKGEMFLKTNDPVSPLLPVLVEGNVQPALTASPSPVRVSARVNEERKAYVVVRGYKAFSILSVDGLGDGVTLANELPDAAAETHRLTLLLKKGEAGDFRRKVKITTDLQKAPVIITIEGSVSP